MKTPLSVKDKEKKLLFKSKRLIEKQKLLWAFDQVFQDNKWPLKYNSP